tara:strand:+ start:258011 stop:258571 length:561 start_codon:yes stop_codon:yes gene_type:complete
MFNSKGKFGFIILSLTLLSIIGPQARASGSHDHSDMGHSHKEHDKKRMSLSKEAKASIVSVLEANEQLHASFFNYDAKKVEENAKNLKEKINSIQDKKLAKLLKFSKVKLSEITAKSSREENNDNYHLVSMALIHVVNKYDVGEKYNAYSCPMVKKKWVQNSKKSNKINNPYAPNMPHCGSKDSNF